MPPDRRDAGRRSPVWGAGPPGGQGRDQVARFPGVPSDASSSTAGGVPIGDRNRVSPLRILEGQFVPGVPVAPPAPASSAQAGGPGIGALLSELQALRQEVALLREDRRTYEGVGRSPGIPETAKDDNLDFFSYLPPLHLQMWYRYYSRIYDPAAAGETTIGSEVTPAGRVIILTNFQFFASRLVAGANPALMGQMELMRSVGFRVRVNGGAPGDIASVDGPLGSKGYGFDFMQLDLSGFRPQFSYYIPPESTLAATYVITAAPTVAPRIVTCVLNGFTIALSDFRRALSAGSLF